LALCSVSLIPACGGDGRVDPGPAPADLQTAGSYQVVSTYDLTVGSVLPQPVAEYAQTVVGLRKDPAGTIFTLLDQAGVPLASDLLGALPDVLANEIKGWINDFVAHDVYGDATVASELDALTAAIETVLARPDVVSALDVSVSDEHGTVTATHTLEELRYHLYGGAVEVAVPIVPPSGTPAPLLVVSTTATGRVTAGLGTEDARLTVDNHAFGVPYGTFALMAIDQAARQRFGTDLRGMLGLLVDCDAMAASVANRCVLSACVGHQSQLAAVCNSGLDLVYSDLRDRIVELNFDALRLQHGDAEMWDASPAGAAADRRIDRLAAGAWDARIDFGMGARAVNGTFTATRASY
jgi:hypothetical protein